jgi:low temperature requirement protein LtrA
LKSYVGFFAILWFTWLQVALFDVRFGHDSAFERVCKAAQFGVMIGLAVESAYYTLDDFSSIPFRNISFILMGSRVVLTIQYGVTLILLKGWKNAHIPLLIHTGTMFTTAMIFLGLAFGFQAPHGVYVIDAWYVTMGIEAGVILLVSGRTKFLNFRRTNIIERLGLLTLIILGEGIMGLAEQVSKINEADALFSSDIIGMLVSSVLVIYFIYFLYFDQTETKGKMVGSLRQQLWTVGHFPLHVCILLVVAGLGQLITWRKLNDVFNPIWTVLNRDLPTDLNPADWQNYVIQVNNTLQNHWPGDYSNALDLLGTPSTDQNVTDMAIWTVMEYVCAYAAGTFGTELQDSENPMADAISVYQTVYIYFFSGAGLVLVSLACIFLLGKKNATRVECASAGVRLAIGSGLTFLATMIVPWLQDKDNNKTFNAFANYFTSPWLIPTVVLAYAIGESSVGWRQGANAFSGGSRCSSRSAEPVVV